MRIKRGLAKKRKHNKVLSLTKGYRLSYHRLYKRAKEAVLHAGQYSYNDRRKRAGDFRRLWIERINAALKQHEISYSKFIGKLKSAQIEINRKLLASLALDNPAAFDAIIKEIK